jgi:hypothetical protein
LLLDDCYQDIDADGDPDLRPHSVLGSAVETFDAQVLLDPLEEQLDLPSAPVQGANGQCAAWGDDQSNAIRLARHEYV